MSFWIYLRFAIGVICILASLVFFVIEIMGVFKMTYALNRMHAAAIGDAIALGLAIIGIVVLNGINLTSFKLLLIPLFMFCTSPVSSHLIARMEIETTADDDKYKVVDIKELDSEQSEEEK